MSPSPSIPSLLALDRDRPRRRIVFVASPDAYALEMIGPMNVLRSANSVLATAGRPDLGYAVEVVASRTGVFFEIPDDGAPGTPQVRTPLGMPEGRRRAPKLGEHNEEVFREYGV